MSHSQKSVDRITIHALPFLELYDDKQLLHLHWLLHSYYAAIERIMRGEKRKGAHFRRFMRTHTICHLHKLAVEEMIRRSMNHNSPMKKPSRRTAFYFTELDVIKGVKWFWDYQKSRNEYRFTRQQLIDIANDFWKKCSRKSGSSKIGYWGLYRYGLIDIRKYL